MATGAALPWSRVELGGQRKAQLLAVRSRCKRSRMSAAGKQSALALLWQQQSFQSSWQQLSRKPQYLLVQEYTFTLRVFLQSCSAD